jgi:hypothetical protein
MTDRLWLDHLRWQYGVLAGLPPIYGLYCAIVPNIVYAIFGTSRESAVAAMALVSLMVGHTITEVIGAGADMQARVAAAVSLAFLTGVSGREGAGVSRGRRHVMIPIRIPICLLTHADHPDHSGTLQYGKPGHLRLDTCHFGVLYGG